MTGRTAWKLYAVAMVALMIMGMGAGVITPGRVEAATINVPAQYATIQAAITAAASGDTINVAAGTYTEVGQILITKNLTIVGADMSSTIIKPNADTGSSNDAKGWWVVSQNVIFNLSGVTLDGSGKKIFQGIRHKGTGTIQNVHFTDIRYNQSSDYQGFAIYAFGLCGAVNVSDCVFDNIGREGMAYWGAGTTGTYARNTYTGKGLGNWLDYGVEVTNSAVVTINDSTITNNLGTATLDGSNSAGIIVLLDNTTATITGNTITGNDIAIKVGYNSPISTATAHVHDNAIYNNTSGSLLGTLCTGAFDATNNWWGAASGPGMVGPGTGDKVSANVTYNPWYNTAAKTTKTYQVGAGQTYTTIQAAITASTSGDTINVSAGTYSENVNVDKSLTLQGVSSTTVIVTAAVNTNSVFTVSANNVNISGFTAQHTTKTGNEGYAGIKFSSGVQNCNIHDNVLTNNQYGILLQDPENTNIPGNNTFTNNDASSNGVSGIEMQHSYGNTFTNNIVNLNGSYGFRLDGVSHNTFTGNTANSNTVNGFSLVKGSSTGGCLHNTFTSNTASSNTQYGLREDNGDSNTLTNNTFNLNGLAGLRLKEVITNLTVNSNNITNNPIGIDIAAPVTNVTTWTVAQNSITGNSNYGISNLGTGALNAINNWWGSNTGPGPVGPGTGDKVTINVTYSPWTIHNAPIPVPSPAGTITVASSAGTLDTVTDTAADAFPTEGLPPLAEMPYGVIGFTVSNLTAGATVTMTLTLPNVPSANLQFWKYLNGEWVDCSSLLSGVADGDNTVFVTIKDGGLGDSDGLANGRIVDPGAFIIPSLPVMFFTQPSHGASMPAVTTPQAPVSLPNVQIQSASLSAKSVTPGAPVTVTIDISNKSTVNGNKKVTLYVNGQADSTQYITVNSGSSSKLTFNISRSEPGDYNVYVDGVPAGSFKVEMFSATDGILIFSAVLVAIAFLLGLVMILRRQRAG